jgi:hypothetical protein
MFLTKALTDRTDHADKYSTDPHSFSITMAEAPPPPLQIPATPMEAPF